VIAELDWLTDPGLAKLPHFLTALAIGLLMGMERERNPRAKAGLRTFALSALLGAACGDIAAQTGATLLLPAGLAVLAAMMIAADFRDRADSDDPGTTTVVAVFVAFSLGAMTMTGQAQLAVMLSIAATILLYFKPELRGIATGLERRDLLSILQFAVVTFIVLPLLPDHDFGPYNALNLRQMWWMVVLISGVSLTGYVALRLVGRSHGAAWLGLLGGLVSSTATTLAYARHTRTNPSLASLSAGIIVLANLVLIVRLGVLAAVVLPTLLPKLAILLAAALAPGAIVAAIAWKRSSGSPELAMPAVSNPAELRAAFAFGLGYALVLLITAWLADVAGSSGVLGVAFVSGLTDVDAITLSSMRLADAGTITETQAVLSIGIAMIANICFKLLLVQLAGGAMLLRRCVPPMLAVAAGAAAALAWILSH